MSNKRSLKAKILWIGRRRADIPAFSSILEEKGYPVTVVTTGKAAREKLNSIELDIVVVDAASMRTTGSRICSDIREQDQNIAIILINAPRKIPSNEVDADIQLVLPFTIRKLENRIIPLSPSDGEKVIEVGPVCLDTDRQVVRCLEKEEHITPRMVKLLELLLNHPGEVQKRETLFKEVWATDYLADMRSLDVHINWLRKAIEKDPSNPQIIITVRGVGYKLEV